MKPYHELHVTYMDADGATPPEFKGWSHSAIAGDIILGEGRKQYLTMHASGSASQVVLIEGMERVADDLRARGLTVLRTKVELVLYDKRTPT